MRDSGPATTEKRAATSERRPLTILFADIAGSTSVAETLDPEDWTVISVTTQDHLLTLTTCNPKGQQTQRLVARAEMVSSQPVA